MKTIKKEVNLELLESTMNIDSNMSGGLFGPFPVVRNKQKLTFNCYEFLDPRDLTHFIDVEIPETLKEFREHHEISKKDLIDWLNKNYK